MIIDKRNAEKKELIKNPSSYGLTMKTTSLIKEILKLTMITNT